LMRVMGWTNAEMGRRLGGLTPEYVGQLRGGRAPGPGTAALFDHVEKEALGDGSDASTRTVDPRELLRQRRLQSGWSIKETAKMAGVRADVLQAIEEGTGQAPEKVMEKIAAALGLEKEALMAGQDEGVVRDAVYGTYGAKPEIEIIGGGKVKYVPLISMAQAGTMDATAFSDEGYKGEGVIAFDVKDPKAFGVRIVGDSMEKRYPAGCTAILYPSFKPSNGGLVVARLREDSGGGVLFKYFTPKDAGKRVILSSENSVYPPVEYKVEEFEWIYPVSDVVLNVLKR
jgi:SOS-response transcriptional repressor LexA